MASRTSQEVKRRAISESCREAMFQLSVFLAIDSWSLLSCFKKKHNNGSCLGLFPFLWPGLVSNLNHSVLDNKTVVGMTLEPLVKKVRSHFIAMKQRQDLPPHYSRLSTALPITMNVKDSQPHPLWEIGSDHFPSWWEECSSTLLLCRATLTHLLPGEWHLALSLDGCFLAG